MAGPGNAADVTLIVGVMLVCLGAFSLLVVRRWAIDGTFSAIILRGWLSLAVGAALIVSYLAVKL